MFIRVISMRDVLLNLVGVVACVWTLAAQSETKPNIVFILADDMSAEEIWPMSQLQALLVSRGTSFSNGFVTTSLCCPSRASILRGQYSHNHGVYGNNSSGNQGGFNYFYDNGLEANTVATGLQAQGYRTGLIGKYLNGYGDMTAHAPSEYVPPGWTDWRVLVGSIKYYNYQLNENGSLVSYGRAETDYQTDVVTDLAVDFIGKAADDARPFFLYIAPTSPHKPYTPAPRHIGLMAGMTAPRAQNFNEVDVSDKPSWVQAYPLLDQAKINLNDQAYQGRMEMNLSVDDMVGRVVAKLEEMGVADNTYIVFTTDNGWMKGEHRLDEGKVNAFEESIRVPYIVRGPGVAENIVRDEFVLNIDFASTFLDIAGDSQTGKNLDGRSILPLLNNTATPPWRDKVLIEYLETGATRTGISKFNAVRTAEYKYVEYIHQAQEKELYDLLLDPYEMDSQHLTASPEVIEPLKLALDALAACGAASCRAADGGLLDNYPPNAVDDVASTLEGQSVTISVLDNDSDPEGDVISVTVASAQNGAVTINVDGTLDYLPNLNFNGTDSISYTVTDVAGATATANVAVTVFPVNDAPVAVDDRADTSIGVPVTFAVLDNDSDVDGDALVVVLVNVRPGNGAAVINPDTTITYTPPAGFAGKKTFTYQVSDGNGESVNAKVTVNMQ